MSKKLIFMLLVLAFALTVSAQAITIIWVSDNGSQGAVTPNKPADHGWVDLLRLEGYTVNYRGEDENDNDYRYWRSLNDNKIAELEDADLIIFSRDNSSGQYNDDPEQGQWNSLSTPIIIQIAHIARTNNRLSWLNSPDTSGAHSPLEAVVPDHPIFEGINFGANNQVDILLPGLGVDFVSTTDPGNGTLLAKRNNDQVWIATWDAGQDYFDGGPYTAGGRRMWFAAGSADSSDGEYNFNAQGTKMFLNAVKYYTGAVYVATNPNPQNGSRPSPTGDSGAGHWMGMTFDKGYGATTHTAYFSEDLAEVEARVENVNLGSSPYAPDPLYETNYYVGKNDPLYPIPEFARTPLERGKTYYWVVDESNAVASYPGEVWSFTIATLAAWDPTPADDAQNIDNTSVVLAWQKGDVDAMTIRYDVYWGTDEETVAGRSDTPDAQVTDPTTATGPLTIDMDYYWKVNTVLIPASPPTVTIEGDLWHFKTKPVFPFTDDPNLIGWWTFDEDSGELVLDHSGYANDGTITGGAQRVPGKIDKAIDVDGDNGKGVEIELTTGWPVANPPELSVAMWVKPHVIDSDDDDTIFFMDQIDGNSKMRCRIHNGDWQFRHGNGTEGGNINSTGPPAILNEWTHYVGMRIDNDALYLYINGQFEDDSDFGVSGRLDPMECWIGAGDDGLGNPNNAFDGLIDDVRLYNRALSASEVAHLVDPALAYKPSPGDGEQDVPLSAKLTWTPGTDQSTGSPYTEHDVYFGTNFDAVDSATTPDEILTGDVNEHPVVLAYGTDYYWRIDGVNAGGGAYKGAVWTFKTMYNPAFARDPDPNDGATGVARNAVLSWTPGDYAPPSNGHYVYFGADDPANIALVADQPQSPNNYSPGTLDLGTTYYWAVDEANTAAPGSVDAGKIWFFTTIDHLVLDDMEEDYVIWGNPGLYACQVWVDGSGDCSAIPGNGTGSLLGLETTISYPDGFEHSIKVEYDNDGIAYNYCTQVDETRLTYSMVKAKVADLPSGIGSDWTTGGAKALSLQFHGSTGNAIEDMWVELTDSAIPTGKATVTYGDYADENKAAIGEPNWHEWNIDLQDFGDGGVDLTKVKTMAIGIGTVGGGAGGGGTVYFDEILLYAPRCLLSRRAADFALVDYAPAGDPNGDCVVNYKELEVMTRDWLDGDETIYATPPGDANLVVHYEFSGHFNDSSANGIDGDPCNGASTLYDAGRASDVAFFDGADDYVNCATDPVLDITDAITITVWMNHSSADTTTNDRGVVGHGGGWDDYGYTLWMHPSNDGPAIRPELQGPADKADVLSNMRPAKDEWHHVAFTWPSEGSADLMTIYVDAQPVSSGPFTGPIGTSTYSLRIGDYSGDPAQNRYFNGMLDDVRIYNKALSPEEIVSTMGVSEIYHPLTSAANISDNEPVNEKKVNFLDYAMLMQRWLDEDMFP